MSDIKQLKKNLKNFNQLIKIIEQKYKHWQINQKKIYVYI